MGGQKVIFLDVKIEKGLFGLFFCKWIEKTDVKIIR